MGLLERANDVLGKFDAKKENANSSTNTGLPAGDYVASLKSVGTFAADSGFHGLSLGFEVVEGDCVGQRESTILSFDEKTPSGKKMPDFVLDKNIKLVARLANAVGYEIQDADFAEEEHSLTDAFKAYQGKVIELSIEEVPNKKDPDNPYRNYDFLPSDVEPKADPFADSGNTIDISDEDIPF
ncbi:DUF669 domain-containing protein [Holzapfeliella sp. JNUCC 80]